jgi:hypothetical protein
VGDAESVGGEHLLWESIVNAMSEIVAAPPQVYAAICAVMGDLSKDGIGKDRKATGGGATYNFRGIDDVYNALSGLLHRHGLLMLPRVQSRTQVERTTKSGGAIFYSTVEAEFDLVSVKDGSTHTIRTVGEAMDSSDKSSNKAMSAAYKYAAMQAFCIPTEGDNDADSTSHDVAPRRHETEAQDDFSPAQSVIAITAKLKATKNKAGLDMSWKDTRQERAKVKAVDEALHANLVGVFTKKAGTFATPDPESILDDEIPY